MAIFVICSRCDRGQVYCREEHRDAARLVYRRRSNVRHQASDDGLADHAQRNRELRERQRAKAAGVLIGAFPSGPRSPAYASGARCE
jgi:hypothetical protein